MAHRLWQASPVRQDSRKWDNGKIARPGAGSIPAPKGHTAETPGGGSQRRGSNPLLLAHTLHVAESPILRVGNVQLSERMLGAVIVSVAVKAMPPVATVTALGDRKE